MIRCAPATLRVVFRVVDGDVCFRSFSLYCPENLMFRERVEDYRSVFEDGSNTELVRSRARKIIKDFCTTDSVMEVHTLLLVSLCLSL